MAGRLLMLSALRQKPKVPFGAASISEYERCIIGKREIVGFGVNGQPHYVDHLACPFPAIRWAEDCPDIKALRQKEKGDWRKLTISEKKALYRASFRQTFAEFLAGRGDWKYVLGMAFLWLAFAELILIWNKLYIYKKEPHTFDELYKKKILRRMIDAHCNPINGVARYWDYEKDTWKK